MRHLPALLALLVLALPAPALAQDPSPLLDDPAGDVRAESAQGGYAVPGFPAVDLLSLAVAEAPDAIAFSLKVADLAPADQDPYADGTVWTLLFSHNGRQFQATAVSFLPALAGDAPATLRFRDDGASEWDLLWRGEARLDLGADTVTIALGRELLADASGAAPFPGRALEQVTAKASTFLSGARFFSSDLTAGGMPAAVADQMPDAGKPAGAYPVKLGIAQTGAARLMSAVPFRSSNGEATTFVYEVEARNVGKQERRFELAAAKVPAGFTVTLPTPTLELDGGESKALPVLVTVPFAHEHGATRSVVVEMRDLQDPGSVGRVELGVRTTFPPQPAGHHDRLFVHAARDDGSPEQLDGIQSHAYMNTLESDPADTGAAIPSSCCLNMNLPDAHHRWTVRLSPALQMGLDFDTGRAGKYAMHISGSAMPQAKLSGALYVSDPSVEDWEAVPVATLATSATKDLLGNGPQLFEGEIHATEEGDLLPFLPGREMWLRLDLASPGVVSTGGPAAASLQPGAYLQLPLVEYHDPVEPILLSADVPVLTPEGAAERPVNPGESVVFPFEVQLPLNMSRVLVTVTGTHADWATPVPSTLDLPGGGSGKGSVVVRVPAGASDGERADLVVRVFDPEQPERQGLARFVAQVDSASDLSDEAPGVAAAAKGSPAPGAWLTLASVALAAMVAGRCRGRKE